jgi:coatomer subunit alpha
MEILWPFLANTVSLLNTVYRISTHTVTAITIANKNFSQHTLIHETIRIKSGAWDDAGVFVYSTLNHIKYCLAQG